MSISFVFDGTQRWSVETGDSLNVLRTMPDACVDAVVTDPPAGIAFMSKKWDDPDAWEAPISESGLSDGGVRLAAPSIGSARNPMCKTCRRHVRGWKGHPGCECANPNTDEMTKNIATREKFVAWLAAILTEAYRVTKPGGRMLCWSIPRTMHWTGCAIEDAGWTIENTVAQIFGTGFPKAKSQLKPAHESWFLARKDIGTLDSAFTLCEVLEQTLAQVRQCSDDLSGKMDTPSLRSKVDTCLSIVTSWHSTLVELCAEMNTSITAMASRTTIDWKTLRFSLSQITQKSTVEPGWNPSGLMSSVSDAAVWFEYAFAELRATLTCIALSSVTSAAVSAETLEVPSQMAGPGKEVASSSRAEYIVLARKPGGKVPPLNIDECRVGLAGGTTKKDATAGAPSVNALADGLNGSYGVPIDGGRWPSNTLFSHSFGCKRNGTKRVMATSIHGEATAIRRSGVHSDAGGHQAIGREQPVRGYADADGKEAVENWSCVDGCPVKLLDEQSGVLKTGAMTATPRKNRGGFSGDMPEIGLGHEASSGTASRFFHCFEADPEALDVEPFHYFAKASTADRNAGCEGLRAEPRSIDGSGFSTETKVRTDEQTESGVKREPSPNNHPTVKSTALMRYLVRLITKPDDIVLDPFCGSGSTGKGALLEGRRFIGIEREAEYADIARARIANAESSHPKTPSAGQLDLLGDK